MMRVLAVPRSIAISCVKDKKAIINSFQIIVPVRAKNFQFSIFNYHTGSIACAMEFAICAISSAGSWSLGLVNNISFSEFIGTR